MVLGPVDWAARVAAAARRGNPIRWNIAAVRITPGEDVGLRVLSLFAAQAD
jgi:hypothetical protein